LYRSLTVLLETRGHFFKQGSCGSTRSVPAEMTRMMDIFLDYKMENEMLRREVAIAKDKASNRPHEPSPLESPEQDHHSHLAQGNQEREDDEYEDDFEEFFVPSSIV
jgi:hypothetical protein